MVYSAVWRISRVYSTRRRKRHRPLTPRIPTDNSNLIASHLFKPQNPQQRPQHSKPKRYYSLLVCWEHCASPQLPQLLAIEAKLVDWTNRRCSWVGRRNDSSNLSFAYLARKNCRKIRGGSVELVASYPRGSRRERRGSDPWDLYRIQYHSQPAWQWNGIRGWSETCSGLLVVTDKPSSKCGSSTLGRLLACKCSWGRWFRWLPRIFDEKPGEEALGSMCGAASRADYGAFQVGGDVGFYHVLMWKHTRRL